ncbi:MAG: hypothetical protein H7338_17920 [Candidatus Sericytochromatia bacterium]|nr:hypothetical protein [Candidatus Sericytochromatia bacterium]
MWKTMLMSVSCSAMLGALPAIAAPDNNNELGAPFLQVPAVDRTTMVMAGTPVMTLVPIGGFTATDRMAEVQRRLIRFLRIEKRDAFAPTPRGIEDFDVEQDLVLVRHTGEPCILYKGELLVTITRPDAKAQDMTVDQLAVRVLQNLRSGMSSLIPHAAASLPRVLTQITTQTADLSYSAAEQAMDEGS